jgi:chromosome segregation ATPase
VEGEVEERKEILQRAVAQTAALEKKVSHVSTSMSSKGMELADRRRKHEIVRRQLQEEYQLARNTAGRHRLEGQQHLRKLLAEVERWTQEVLGVQQSLREMEAAKEGLTAANPSVTVDILRSDIHREMIRQQELTRTLQEEEGVLGCGNDSYPQATPVIDRGAQSLLSPMRD